MCMTPWYYMQLIPCLQTHMPAHHPTTPCSHRVMCALKPVSVWHAMLQHVVPVREYFRSLPSAGTATAPRLPNCLSLFTHVAVDFCVLIWGAQLWCVCAYTYQMQLTIGTDWVDSRDTKSYINTAHISVSPFRGNFLAYLINVWVSSSWLELSLKLIFTNLIT